MMAPARRSRRWSGPPTRACHDLPAAVAAVDLGASGGRVMLGVIGRASSWSCMSCTGSPTSRSGCSGPSTGTSCALFQGVLDGLARRGRAGAELASVGIDTWGVDYGLLDADGALLGNPVHYRDARTDGVAGQVLAQVPAAELYAITGIQQLPLNTIFQLAAAAGTPQLAAAADPADDPGSAGLLAHRAGRRGADQRVHHPALRRARAGLGHRRS